MNLLLEINFNIENIQWNTGGNKFWPYALQQRVCICHKWTLKAKWYASSVFQLCVTSSIHVSSSWLVPVNEACQQTPPRLQSGYHFYFLVGTSRDLLSWLIFCGFPQSLETGWYLKVGHDDFHVLPISSFGISLTTIYMTKSTEHSPWKANSHSASQEIRLL